MPHERDFRVIEGGRKLSPEAELELTFDGGEWGAVKRVQALWLESSRSHIDAAGWIAVLERELDTVREHARYMDNPRQRELLCDWLRQLAGSTMAWHHRLSEQDTEGAA